MCDQMSIHPYIPYMMYTNVSHTFLQIDEPKACASQGECAPCHSWSADDSDTPCSICSAHTHTNEQTFSHSTNHLLNRMVQPWRTLMPSLLYSTLYYFCKPYNSWKVMERNCQSTSPASALGDSLMTHWWLSDDSFMAIVRKKLW